MHLLLRYPALSLAALFATVTALLCTINPVPGFILSSHGVPVSQTKPFHKSVKMLENYYLQRSYGNPGANIDALLWEAFHQVDGTAQSAMMKPFSVANTWKLEGPVNIGGRMRSVVFHPTETNTIFAGGASGGVWKSTDLGASWAPLSDDQPRLAIGAVAIDQRNPEIIYAGTGEPSGWGYGRGNGSPFYDGVGVIKSTDGGASWRLLPWPSTFSAVHRIVLHPESSDTLLVATTERLMKSTDGGQTWENVLNGVVTEVQYKPDNPSLVYAAVGSNSGGSANGVYLSGAGGARFSWRKLGVNFAASDSTGRIIFTIPKSSPNRIYAAVGLNRGLIVTEEADFLGVFVSRDGGESWERKPSAIANTFARGQAWYDLCIAASPHDPDLVLLGGIDMYRSSNGGDGFVKVSRWELRVSDPNNPAYVHADQHSITFKPDDPNFVLVGNDGGAFVSLDGGLNWDERNTNLATTQFYAIAYAPSKPQLLFGGTQDNSNMRLRTPGEQQWLYVGGGDGGRIAVDPKDADNFYFNQNSSPFRTFDGGQQYEWIGEGLQGKRFNWIRPMVLSTDGSKLYTASNQVHSLTPAKTGNQWMSISPTLAADGGIITDLEIVPNQLRWMFASTSNGKVYYSDNLTALDVEWFNISSGLPNRWVTDITLGWTDHRTIYACFSGYGSGHAYKSTNLGASWTNISGDLPDVPANAIIPSRTEPNTIFLATDLGVWFTTNGGENWKQFGNGLPNAVCYDMKLTPDNVLVVGTFGRGVWSTDVTVASLERPDESTAFASLHVAPNPVTLDGTTLRFTLRGSGVTRVAVYDAAGRLVATLLDGRREMGSHTLRFATGGLRRGGYFAVLEQNGQRITRKFAVL